jgi:hypothetical protein
MIKNEEREKARMPRLNRLARLFSSVALLPSSSSCCYLFLVHSSMRKRSRRSGTKKNRLAKRCATFFAILGRFLTFLVFVQLFRIFIIIITLVDTIHGRGIDEDGEYDNGGVVKL